ncbi:type IV toxin-antitoxin system AbiEi family antitoxin [Leifsonia sp. NPDC077715]|uniref:type IV toxin-antitoxin system AbiEi family antitoxin n=1 Tax=Leifsonia sp. NPDC077715 TaxID=3155539 RepID=UPI0034178E0F
MSSITSSLLDADVLPLAELFALCLDGQLFRVGDAFAAIGTPVGPELRAAAFVRSAPGWTVADRGSAAWIHGTRASPPPLPQVCVPCTRRGRVSSGLVDACHRTLAPDETVTIGPALVTTPLRTALDLVCDPARFGPRQALEVRRLLALASVGVEELSERLDSRPRKGADLARGRLPDVARLPEVAPLPWPVAGVSPR